MVRYPIDKQLSKLAVPYLIDLGFWINLSECVIVFYPE